MNELTTLWSLRYSPARGKHFKAERQCTIETAADWLAIFQADEPDVFFMTAHRKPSSKP